jgi:hypothetical protein
VYAHKVLVNEQCSLSHSSLHVAFQRHTCVMNIVCDCLAKFMEPEVKLFVNKHDNVSAVVNLRTNIQGFPEISR